MVLQSKGLPGLPSSYRSLCMLDKQEKVLEKLIKPRLQEPIRADEALSIDRMVPRTLHHQYYLR